MLRLTLSIVFTGANAGILCYDITDSASFEEMGRWLVELKQNLGEDVILHVVGTKADLVAEHPSRRKVPFERCIAYVAENLYPTQFTQQQQEHKQPQHNAGTPAPQTLNAYVWASGLGGTPAVTTTSTAPVTPAANGGIASPVSNRSSGFWGLDVGWDCCHEISAKDGEGVEEVFRVITRKLVEQRNERLEAEARLLEDVRRTMPSGSYASDGYGGHGGGGDYFSGGRGVANGGSFRVGIGDRRKSWFGVRSGGDGMIGTEAEWEDEIRRRRSEKAGRCC